MAGPGGLASDEQILELLRQERSIGYIACHLGINPQRIKTLLDKFKPDIVLSRVHKGQTPEGIALQLELVHKLDSIRKWIKENT